MEFYHRINPDKEMMVELSSSSFEDDVIDLDRTKMALREPKLVNVLLNGELIDCFFDK